MWSLIYDGEKGPEAAKSSPTDVCFLCGPEYVVGRKNVDILLNDDPSISRKHATLSASFNETQLSNPTSLPILSMTDFSKFGTFVGENKMSGATCTLSDGDVIKFGQMHNVYRVKYTRFVVATSSLSGADKMKMKQCLLQLGAHQVSDWNGDCDVLVMGKVGVTVKAVCALACLKPIVTVDYIENLVHAFNNKTSKPSPERCHDYKIRFIQTHLYSTLLQDFVGFAPILAEEGDKYLLRPKQQRQQLFEGRTFFFCNKSQFGKMKMPVELAGGKALLLESKPRSLSQLTTKGAILMYCDTALQPGWYNDCVTYLNRKSKRYIQDAEIGHAVLYCSTDKHCNPEQEAGSKLHEEFSQKLSNTQPMTQRCPPTQKAPDVNPKPSLNTATSMVVPDSQTSTRSRAGDRSLHIKDMLSSPDVTNVPETQKRKEFATPAAKNVKKEPAVAESSTVKRKSDTDVGLLNKRTRLATRLAVKANVEDYTQYDTGSAATEYGGDNSEVDGLRMTVNDESSTVPSMRNIHTPEKTTTSSQLDTADYDVSVVEETQSSASSMKQQDDDLRVKPESCGVKSEPAQPREPPPIQPEVPTRVPNMDEFSEERKVEIGASWDRVQVEYGSLFRKTKPPTFNSGSSAVPERRGMALWKGKWVPNFKRFKKCGKKDAARLPTIIGGGDLVDALCCSQGESQTDFVDVPTQENVRRSEVIAPFSAPAKTTIKSSAFGGQWELPSAKK